MRGRFIVFEGGDGTGKTTQARILAAGLEAAGVHVVHTREPGGTALGSRIRELVLDPGSGDVSPVAEALLYAADKAQHVHEVILPAIAAGQTVVCDRYVDSTLAYQGAGRRLDASADLLGGLERVATWATGGLVADLTVLFDIDPANAVARKANKDRLEAAGTEFHRRARELFLELASRAPERYLVLPALRDRTWTAREVWRRVCELPGLENLAGFEQLSDPSGTMKP